MRKQLGTKGGLLGKAQGPVKIGEHEYLVVPVCKVVELCSAVQRQVHRSQKDKVICGWVLVT